MIWCLFAKSVDEHVDEKDQVLLPHQIQQRRASKWSRVAVPVAKSLSYANKC